MAWSMNIPTYAIHDSRGEIGRRRYTTLAAAKLAAADAIDLFGAKIAGAFVVRVA